MLFRSKQKYRHLFLISLLIAVTPDQTAAIQFGPSSQDLLLLMRWKPVVWLVHPSVHFLFDPIYRQIKSLRVDYFV